MPTDLPKAFQNRHTNQICGKKCKVSIMCIACPRYPAQEQRFRFLFRFMNPAYKRNPERREIPPTSGILRAGDAENAQALKKNPRPPILVQEGRAGPSAHIGPRRPGGLIGEVPDQEHRGKSVRILCFTKKFFSHAPSFRQNPAEDLRHLPFSLNSSSFVVL